MSDGNALPVSRRLLLVFLGLTLLPVAAMVWLGWRFVQQDQLLEAQRLQERVDHAATLIVAGLNQAIEADEQLLADASNRQQLEDRNARIIVFTSRGYEIQPPSRLLYYPGRSPSIEANEELFRAGESDEYQRQDYAAAIEKFRKLAAESNSEIRAGAQLRLARNLRKSGNPKEALRIWADLEKNSASLAGVPVELLARHARCGIFAGLGDEAALRDEAEKLYGQLITGHWRLSRGSYLHYMEEVDRWRDPEKTRADLEAALWSQGVWRLSEIWEQARPPEAPVETGREVVSFRDGAGVLLWRRSEDRLVALAVSPAYVREKWQSRIDSIRSSQEVALELTDPEADGPSVKAFSRNQLPLDTGLPWRITVAPANPLEETAQSASRRHLLMGGLGLLLLVVAAGGYFVARSVKRELELARLQSDFVAAVSHEFRTPLTSLGQATELLVDGRITDPEQLKKYFEKQARATGRLRRLVESLLEWGRVEAGRTPYRMEKLDASDVVRAAVDEFRRDEPGGHAIEYSPADAAVVIHGDRDALIRALRNLLDNAVKYSPGCPTVWVQLRSLDGRAEISVKDSGLGIPRNEHRDIFRKFVRGAAAKAHAIKGTGVGLAMVKHIVECHGGEIHLESEPGAGSTFTIVL